MDIRKYLTVQIKKCRNRMNLARLIDCAIVFAAAGGVLGTACELVSLVCPFIMYIWRQVCVLDWDFWPEQAARCIGGRIWSRPPAVWTPLD